MRLFIAINFDSRTKLRITAVQKQLAEYTDGNFTRPDNIHLTLAFLGQVQPQAVHKIEKAMQSVRFSPINIGFTHVGRFTRKNRDIWWIGIKRDDALFELHKELTEALAGFGFCLNEQRYTPHITLARQVKTNSYVKKETLFTGPFSTRIHSISLMHSHRVDDKLTYTEIFKVQAKTNH